jgi:hypothetical protein
VTRTSRSQTASSRGGMATAPQASLAPPAKRAGKSSGYFCGSRGCAVAGRMRLGGLMGPSRSPRGGGRCPDEAGRSCRRAHRHLATPGAAGVPRAEGKTRGGVACRVLQRRQRGPPRARSRLATGASPTPIPGSSFRDSTSGTATASRAAPHREARDRRADGAVGGRHRRHLEQGRHLLPRRWSPQRNRACVNPPKAYGAAV